MTEALRLGANGTGQQRFRRRPDLKARNEMTG